jgi:anti-sigma regulatory factor (Ser/Thr protein kinase)
VPTVQLQFPSKSVYVGVARLAVAGIARAAGFDEDTVFDLKTAVSEAVSTAVLLGEEAGSETPIDLAWEDRVDSVVIEVHHAGTLSEPATGAEPGDQQAMALALLRSLVDESEFVSEDDGTTTIRLTLRR